LTGGGRCRDKRVALDFLVCSRVPAESGAAASQVCFYPAQQFTFVTCRHEGTEQSSPKQAIPTDLAVLLANGRQTDGSSRPY